MKVVTTLVAVLLAGVVLTFSAERPTELPIGSREKIYQYLMGRAEWINVSLDKKDPSGPFGWKIIVSRSGYYSPSDGDLLTILSQRLNGMLNDTLPGQYTETSDLYVSFHVTGTSVTKRAGEWVETGITLMLSNIHFRLERDSTGNLRVPPRLFEAPFLLRYEDGVVYDRPSELTDPYLGTITPEIEVYYPGVRSVLISVKDASGNFVDGLPSACPAYHEIGLMLLPTGLMTGEKLRKNGWTGELTIYLDAFNPYAEYDRRAYDRFDILTGQLIERFVPFSVGISRTSDGGVEVTIEGISSASVTLEESEDLKNWRTIATLVGKAGEPQYYRPTTDGRVRFYRARAAPKE